MKRTAVLLGCSLALLSCRSTTSPEPEEEARPAVCPTPPPSSLAPDSATGDTLFAVVEAPQLTAAQENLLSMVRSRATSAEVHVARTSTSPDSLLSIGGTLILNVAPGRTFAVTGEERELSSPDYLYWLGSIGDELSSVTLLLGPEGLTGSLHVYADPPPSVYRFEPLGEGLLAVSCLDPTHFRQD